MHNTMGVRQRVVQVCPSKLRLVYITCGHILTQSCYIRSLPQQKNTENVKNVKNC